MDAFDFTGYDELVYCGYGEPTCRLDVLLETAKYARENYGVSIRITDAVLVASDTEGAAAIAAVCNISVNLIFVSV